MLAGRPLVTFVAYRPQAPSGRGELASCCLHALAAAGHLPSDAAVRRWPGCRDAATVSAFAEDLAEHGGDPARSPGPARACRRRSLPGSAATFRTRRWPPTGSTLIKMLSEAVDEVARA